jgi:hypothetical protein
MRGKYMSFPSGRLMAVVCAEDQSELLIHRPRSIPTPSLSIPRASSNDIRPDKGLVMPGRTGAMQPVLITG